jgi:hypothetical protein
MVSLPGHVVHFLPEFRARLRPKPGSIMADGALVTYQGVGDYQGPCWIPDPRTERFRVPAHKPARLRHINAAGWRRVAAADLPGMPPRQGLICLRREKPQSPFAEPVPELVYLVGQPPIVIPDRNNWPACGDGGE